MNCPNCGKPLPDNITPTVYKGQDLCSLACYRARVTKNEPDVSTMINGMFGRKPK